MHAQSTKTLCRNGICLAILYIGVLIWLFIQAAGANGPQTHDLARDQLSVLRCISKHAGQIPINRSRSGIRQMLVIQPAVNL